MTNTLPGVAVVVLNWNGRDDTLECLSSLKKIDYPNWTVIVADNGSSDNSVSAIREQYPDIDLVENGTNLGFAEGNNRAIARALEGGAEFVLILNNDTVVDPEIVSAFVRAAEQMPGGGVFGAKIYHYHQKDLLWYAGGYWDPETLRFEERGAGLRDEGQFEELTETEWVIGCAMFVRASVFRSIGLLEPKFFLNNEEIDFCSRAKRAGFSCVFVPDAKVWHKISVSFGGEHSPLKEYFIARNRLLWAQRNADTALRFRIYGQTLLGLVRRFLFPLGGRHQQPIDLRRWWWRVRETFVDPINRAHFLGVRDFVLGRFGDCPDAVRVLAKNWGRKSAADSSTLMSPQEP
ncbi:glycosyltransferase family 2 protein [Methylocaldum sp.]|uniref:glycosyltransferase family 2 protein n=1 Tax=Methylocaldum sp. TaxID=1969727 RepID=UPI002D66B1F1|nr:glycosyltransferase family 2 protein [Methylocaldum sp.]HYE37879.1 glycosyltransferase family 2 protein [Methylocaldum sp.]